MIEKKGITEVHIAEKLASPERIQEYGVGKFQLAFTKSALKKALKKGFVKIDGTVATTATFVRGGEKIEVSVSNPQQPQKRLNLSLQVLFEDSFLAVIHKPAGILVSGNSFMTVANALEQNLATSSLADSTKPWPVHRLDYATTGALLIGKTSSSIRLLSKLFADKEIEKTYHAITIRRMQNLGRIDASVDGKNAVSHYEVLKSVDSKRFTRLNLVELKPETGRRHQLRKHLSAIGNPILGDRDYGIPGLILKGKGLYLHASALQFKHPFSDENVVIEAELPKKFKKIFP